MISSFLSMMLKIKHKLMLEMNSKKCLVSDSRVMLLEDLQELSSLVHQALVEIPKPQLLLNNLDSFIFLLDNFLKVKSKRIQKQARSLASASMMELKSPMKSLIH